LRPPNHKAFRRATAVRSWRSNPGASFAGNSSPVRDQCLANLSEAAFSTVKRAPAYPGRFLDDTQAKEYFSRCFTWYDTEHYHSGSHPATSPSGLRPIIVEQRRTKKLAQRRRRREANQKQQTDPRKTNKRKTMPADLVA